MVNIGAVINQQQEHPMSTVTNVAISLDIPISLKQQMDAYKEDTGLSQAAIIRLAVKRFIATHKLVEVETAEEKAA